MRAACLLVSALLLLTAPVAASPLCLAAAPAGKAVPMGQWLVVRESKGGGLPKGAGIRFRAEGFDVAKAGTGGSANPGKCVPSGAELKCESGLLARIEGDGVRVEQGSLVLTLAPASATEAAAFEQALADSDAQLAACMAAAKCCRASEGPLGQKCDLNATLGKRTLASCRGAIAKLRADLAAKKATPPAECR